MLNLLGLDKTRFFGSGMNVSFNNAVFVLCLAEALVILIGIILFFVLIVRTRRARQQAAEGEVEQQTDGIVVADTAATTAEAVIAEPARVYVHEPIPEPERVLLGISLDIGVVQREFTAGDKFGCNGMIVRASYNVEPLVETIVSYSVVDQDVYERLSVTDVKVCYVLRPDLSEPGIKFVSVKYLDQTAIYTVSVKEPVIEEEPQPAPVVVEQKEPEKEIVYVEKVVEKVVEVEKPVVVEQPNTIIIEEESAEAGTLRYDRSFMARYIQSPDEIKHWYTELKNKLLSYKKVHARTSWKRETFKAGKDVVAKLAFRGKTLCIYLPLDPNEFVDTKYDVENESKTPAYADTPAMVRIKNDKHAKQALDLIAIAMQKLELKEAPYVSQDFYLPYEGVVELINKGLIRREVKSSADEAIFIRAKTNEETNK